MANNSSSLQQSLNAPSLAEDLSASIDALPPRRGQDLFGSGATSTGRPGPAGHHHSRTKSKTDFLDLADSTTRLGISPDVNSQRLEQKRAEHERQKAEQKRVFAAQMRALEAQHESEERELLGVAASAPTTPPRSEDDNVVGAPGAEWQQLNHQSGRYGEIGLPKLNSFREFANNSKSVPASRRHSGHDEETLGLDKLNLGVNNSLTVPHPQKGSLRSLKGVPISSEAPSVTSFLFDDELETEMQQTTFGGKYLQMNTEDDKFPILVRRDSFPGMLSASSAALDLAPLAQTPPRHSILIRPTTMPRGNDWSPFDSPASLRPQHHSHNQALEPDCSRLGANPPTSAAASLHADSRSPPISERGTSPRLARMANLNGVASHRAPSSLSASKNSNAIGTPSGGAPIINSVLSSSPKQDKKGPSLLPSSSPGTLNATSGKCYSGSDFSSLRPPLPASSKTIDGTGLAAGSFRLGEGASLDSSFGPYNPAGLSASAVSGLGFGFDGVEGYGAALGSGGANSSQAFLSKAAKRDPETNKFANIRLEDMQGDMFGLCKDQHGCRFLQRKLEEGDPKHRDMIFAEIYPHFGELMTDAFGNYLSQKLLEYSSDEQRDLLIESISGELVSISLNMHGTRAVQKMIDFLSTQRQVQSLIVALNLNVVTLIKDLNGNHVIQKCLNHLPPEDNQFIYNAVATNCIEVATHRHGCCVLQRCIDHASESQRIQLVTEITYNSLTLVQDPFGNYVVQYVLDLNDSRFIEAIVRQFLGNVCALSMQKFSSNVVEKCIRVSDPAGRRALVEELSGRQRLERLLRDSFANYVVQTALDYSDPAQRTQLVDNIKPILPMIRNTPYGKRIQSKIQRENMDPLRSAGGGYHPTLVSGAYFLAPSHMPAPNPPHHAQSIVDGRHAPPFLGSNAGNLSSANHSIVSSNRPTHQLSSPTRVPPTGFSTPWATSALTGPVPLAYTGIGMGLRRENQPASYSPFM